MKPEVFNSTTTGQEYMKSKQEGGPVPPVDSLLDFMNQLKNLKNQTDNPEWKQKYQNEIDAILFILKTEY